MAYILHKVLSHLFVLFLRASNTDCIMSGTDNRVKTYNVLQNRELKYNFLQKLYFPLNFTHTLTL